jgi:predicted dehydrogenase
MSESRFDTLNIGVLGLGRVLDYHLPPLSESGDRFRIAGVFDLSERRRNEVADELDATAFPSYDAMLADPRIDLILVGTPPTFHAASAVQALQSKKHVLVEKPMALNTADAAAMIDAADANGKLLAVNHNHRFSSVLQFPAIKDALDRQIIGRPYQYKVQVMSGRGGYAGSPDYVPRWEAKKEHGGGTLFSWGPHLVDLIMQAHGAAPRRVFAMLNSRGWDFDGDSNASLVLVFDDCATAQIELSYVSPEARRTFYVRGDNGSLTFDADVGANQVSAIVGNVKTGFQDREVPDQNPPQNSIYLNLYDAIRNGDELLINPRDIRLVIATLEAAQLSAETGRVVEVSEVLETV